MRTPQFYIGTKFILYGSKRKDIMTITDIYTTTDSTGDVVRYEYLAEYEFMGQLVKGVFPQSSIARSEIIK